VLGENIDLNGYNL